MKPCACGKERTTEDPIVVEAWTTKNRGQTKTFRLGAGIRTDSTVRACVDCGTLYLERQ